MRVRTTRVSFAEVVGPEATEVEFDPATDYLVLRSLYAYPTGQIRDFVGRLGTLTTESTEQEAADLTIELLGRTVAEWHLLGEDGKPIPQPATRADLEALPGAVRGALFPFLATFRGRPDPTPAE